MTRPASIARAAVSCPGIAVACADVLAQGVRASMTAPPGPGCDGQ